MPDQQPAEITPATSARRYSSSLNPSALMKQRSDQRAGNHANQEARGGDPEFCGEGRVVDVQFATQPKRRKPMRRLAFAMLSATISTLPAHASSQRMAFSDRPILRIGPDEPGMTDLPGVVWAARLPDGTVAIAGPSQIVLFNAEGKRLRMMATSGEGPGELRTVAWAGRRRDTLFTFDMTLSRLTAYAGTSAISTRFAPVSASGGRTVAIGRLSNGDIVLQSILPPPRQHADGPFRDTTRLWVARMPYTRPLKAMSPAFPGIAWFAYNPPGGNRTHLGIDVLVPRTSVVASGDLVWVGDPMSDIIVAYRSDGAIVYRVKVPWGSTTMSASQLRVIRDEAVARTREEARPLTASMFDRPSATSSLPILNRLIPAESNGEVWLESYAPGSTTIPSYALIGKDGRVHATMRGPAGVRFFEIGTQFAVGTVSDSDDLRSVVVYRIEQR